MIKIMKLDATSIWFRMDFNHHQQSFSFIHNHTNINEETKTPHILWMNLKNHQFSKNCIRFFFWSWKNTFPEGFLSSQFGGHCPACANASDNVRCTRFFTIFTVLDIGMTCKLRCFGCVWFFCWPLVNWRQDAKQQQKTPVDMLGYTEILVLHSGSRWRSLLLGFNKTVSCCLPRVRQIVAKCFTNISLSDFI